MSFTPRQIRVYENASLILKEEFDYKVLLEELNELTELIDLFCKGGNPRERVLLIKRKKIIKQYTPKIKECKRVLTNTQKRLTYNIGLSKTAFSH